MRAITGVFERIAEMLYAGSRCKDIYIFGPVGNRNVSAGDRPMRKSVKSSVWLGPVAKALAGGEKIVSSEELDGIMIPSEADGWVDWRMSYPPPNLARHFFFA